MVAHAVLLFVLSVVEVAGPTSFDGGAAGTNLLLPTYCFFASSAGAIGTSCLFAADELCATTRSVVVAAAAAAAAEQRRKSNRIAGVAADGRYVQDERAGRFTYAMDNDGTNNTAAGSSRVLHSTTTMG